MDFYQAESEGAAPVVFYLHGGGWMDGDKSKVNKWDTNRILEAGISIVSINYRYVSHAKEASVFPPVKWPMDDTVRALQFLRSKADEWNINPDRIAGMGGSAGACSLLWVGLQDDLADHDAEDRIEHYSTNLYCLALDGVQTTLDPVVTREMSPNAWYGGHAFGFDYSLEKGERDELFAVFYERRDEVDEWIQKYSPIEYASAGDPPIYLYYKYEPGFGARQKDPTHSANFGVLLYEKLRVVGVECDFYYPNSKLTTYDSMENYVIDKLLEK
ncbi:alpha/beta hydrolase [Pelagicoccus albus]|uniref:Alpha/beta hydrolase n=1 Tax=Pelagicoccus albus TaxID=415222 RepID=A0A7X1B5R3_9BACT|nr:alpha/beta hydrolase [Pelagicoccus albus]MBC2606117.1 alpha/beta hydrolase [Pelagicoccus albus]